MPIKTSSGKWKWGNIERKTKGELVRTVYGIWKKNGSKGSFSDFWHGRHRISESNEELVFVGDLDYKKHIQPILNKLKTWKNVNVQNIRKYSGDKNLKWFGLYSGNSVQDIVALATMMINFEDKTVTLENICSGGGGTGKALMEDLIVYYSDNRQVDYFTWFADPSGGERLVDYYEKSFPNAKVEDYENEYWKTKKFTIDLKKKSMNESEYERPWTMDEIKANLPDLYDELKDDPIHKWRAETGIELIHKEPSRKELDRIWKNWNLMDDEMKAKSDEKSIELFGMTNKEHYLALTNDIGKSLLEYAGNKYYVHVDPRIQKPGQSTGWEGIEFTKPGFKEATRRDCVIRALSLATGLSYINVARKLRVPLDDKNDVPGIFEGYAWKDVFKFFNNTYKISDMKLFFEFLKNKVFSSQMTVKDFTRTVSRHTDFKDKYLIIACVDPDGRNLAHAVFVKNGRYYDTWDSGDWIVKDVFDATNERRPTAYDFRNIVQIRNHTKKRYRSEKSE